MEVDVEPTPFVKRKLPEAPGDDARLAYLALKIAAMISRDPDFEGADDADKIFLALLVSGGAATANPHWFASAYIDAARGIAAEDNLRVEEILIRQATLVAHWIRTYPALTEEELRATAPGR